MVFTFIRRDETELPGWISGSPPLGLKGPLWEDPENPLRGIIPGYDEPLPQGTIHLPQAKPGKPRRINYHRTVLLSAGDSFMFPAGMARFFSCSVYSLSGEMLAQTWIPAIREPEEISADFCALKLVSRVPHYEAAFPDDLPAVVRVVDEINPDIGSGRLELTIALNGQDFGVLESPMFTLIGSELTVPRPAAPAPRARRH